MNPNETRPVEVHRPTPITAQQGGAAAPLLPVQPTVGGLPDVASVVLPDGRIVTGYTLALAAQEQHGPERPAVSRLALNIALGGIGFAAVCGGLVLLTTFIAALAALIQQLIILAAVIFGGFIAAQVLGVTRREPTTVHIRKAVIKRNHFHG